MTATNLYLNLFPQTDPWKAPCRKLSSNEVHAIRRSKESYQKIADRFKVSVKAVARLKRKNRRPGPANGHRMSDKDRSRRDRSIVTLKANGMRVDDIAERHGCSVHTVYRVCAAARPE